MKSIITGHRDNGGHGYSGLVCSLSHPSSKEQYPFCDMQLHIIRLNKMRLHCVCMWDTEYQLNLSQKCRRILQHLFTLVRIPETLATSYLWNEHVGQCCARIRILTPPHDKNEKGPVSTWWCRTATRSFVVFFDLCLNKRSSKQSPLVWDAIALIMASLENCSQTVIQNSPIFNVLVPFIISDLSWKFHKIWSHIFFVILHKARETNQQLIRLNMPVGK